MKGNVVEVRATKPGYVGFVAQFVVDPAVPTGAFRLTSTGCLRGTTKVRCPK
jgi:hypothetical protein